MQDYGYTLDNYRSLLKRFLEAGYEFLPYEAELRGRKALLLRHDIDYTLVFAEQFARINAELGVSGTFFFQLRSSLYNFMDHTVQAAVRRIVDMGQHIGFHAVVASSFPSVDELRDYIASEFDLFRQLVPETSPVFAWHNPGILQAEGFDFIKADFTGLINAYADINGVEVPYYADSNMRYSFDDLCALADRNIPAMQLALAPMQWCPEQPDMRHVMVANLARKLLDVEQGFSENYVYAEMFPEGLPKSFLERFSRLCFDAAAAPAEKGA